MSKPSRKTKKRLKPQPPKTNKRPVVPPRIHELQDQLDTRAIGKATQTKFTTILLRHIYKLCLAGYTDHELCDLHSFSYDHWKAMTNPKDASYVPELAEAIYRGRDGAVSDVAHALTRRAKGYSHSATKFFMDRDGNIVSQEYTEYYPPDTNAASFILKNKRPKQWKDKQVVEHDGPAISVSPTINVITSDDKKKQLLKDYEERKAVKNKQPKKAV